MVCRTSSQKWRATLPPPWTTSTGPHARSLIGAAMRLVAMLVLALLVPAIQSAKIVVENGGAINLVGGPSGGGGGGGDCSCPDHSAEFAEMKAKLDGIMNHLGVLPPSAPPSPLPPASPIVGGYKWRVTNYEAQPSTADAMCLAAFILYSDTSCTTEITGGTWSESSKLNYEYTGENLKRKSSNTCTSLTASCENNVPWCSKLAATTKHGQWVERTFDTVQDVKCAKVFYQTDHPPPAWAPARVVIMADVGPNSAMVEVSAASSPSCYGSPGRGCQYGRQLEITGP